MPSLVTLETCIAELLSRVEKKDHFWEGKNCHTVVEFTINQLNSVCLNNTNTSVFLDISVKVSVKYTMELFSNFIFTFYQIALSSLTFNCASVRSIISLNRKCLSDNISSKCILKELVFSNVIVDVFSVIFVTGMVYN